MPFVRRVSLTREAAFHTEFFSTVAGNFILILPSLHPKRQRRALYRHAHRVRSFSEVELDSHAESFCRFSMFSSHVGPKTADERSHLWTRFSWRDRDSKERDVCM